VVWATPAPQIVSPEDVRALQAQTARLQRLAQARHAHLHPWRLPPGVAALQALRGVQCPVAVTLVAERGDLTRFDPPRQLMTALGLRPSADGRGERRRQGTLPQAGHRHARRVLGEGAWASRYPANGSRHGPLRREQLPQPSQDRSWKAPGRWCPRDRQLMARGNHAHPVVVAIARALVGVRWAMAQPVPFTSAGPHSQPPETHTSVGDLRGIGSAAAPVGRHPRPRDEPGRPPRASSAAGTRRRHVRWPQPTESSRLNRRV
jgi:transposase